MTKGIEQLRNAVNILKADQETLKTHHESIIRNYETNVGILKSVQTLIEDDLETCEKNNWIPNRHVLAIAQALNVKETTLKAEHEQES